MKWVVIVVRTLVGLMFVAASVAYFLVPPPEAELPPDAKAFGEALGRSHYMTAVKGLELAGGLLLLSGRAAPLGITVLTPIAVNILFFELFLLRAPGPGAVLVALFAFLIWGYRAYFAPVFTLRAAVTCGRPARAAGWDVVAGGGGNGPTGG